jgi:hypothetical protein
MTRSILSGLLALVCVGAVGVVPVACQSGGVGDPCTPEAEYDTQFSGFKAQEEFIESRSFQCSTRICLVNHFQGRVSCPRGQAGDALKQCAGAGRDDQCDAGEKCTESQTLSGEDCKVDGDCPQGTVCDLKKQICVCTGAGYTDPNTGVAYNCEQVDPKCVGASCTSVLKSYVCHKPGNCQQADFTDAQNTGKDCCVPGTDTPVNVAVCGQCDTTSHRNAADAVYCSCRCCPKCCDEAAGITTDCEKDKSICGAACDPNFNYCSCPNGFACSKIRDKVGLGDEQLTGAYCIKSGTAYNANSGAACGQVKGFVADSKLCVGSAASTITGDGG